MLTYYFLQNIINVVIDSPLLKILYIPFPTWSESVVSTSLLWFGSFCFWVRSTPLLAAPPQHELPVLIQTWNDPKMNIHKLQMIYILKDKSPRGVSRLVFSQQFSLPCNSGSSFVCSLKKAVLSCEMSYFFQSTFINRVLTLKYHWKGRFYLILEFSAFPPVISYMLDSP